LRKSDKKTKYCGIILAGGSGTRLFPVTGAVCKQLLPVYDKPMIYYSLSTLMLAGIKDILIITTPEDKNSFKKLLGYGSQWGISLNYIEQARPEGIAQAFLIGEDFIGNNPVCLILGDNIFYAQGLAKQLQNAAQKISGATIFGYYVNNPKRYGTIKFARSGEIEDIVEKPVNPPSNYAVTGLYFYDNRVCKLAKTLKPSKRGELEITDLNRLYLQQSKLNLEILSRGTAWLDTGTFNSLLEASQFVKIVEERQGLKIACLEEIAWRMGYINTMKLAQIAETTQNNSYGNYLKRILNLPQK
jgi:glucose-1-phosphate thymidylyltransferase